jgi:hypothetical protein
MQVKTTHPISQPVKSDPPKQHKTDNDDQDGAERKKWLHYPALVMALS